VETAQESVGTALHPQIMSAFEGFLKDNPNMADQPYGAAMARTLIKVFPCGTL
jgi:hypothetical protein